MVTSSIEDVKDRHEPMIPEITSNLYREQRGDTNG